jgi:hypothetical protein
MRLQLDIWLRSIVYSTYCKYVKHAAEKKEHNATVKAAKKAGKK